MPVALATIDWVVAPLLHRYDAPLLAVSVTLPPGQNVVDPDGVMVGVVAPETVTVFGADVAEQLFASVTVTV